VSFRQNSVRRKTFAKEYGVAFAGGVLKLLSLPSLFWKFSKGQTTIG